MLCSFPAACARSPYQEVAESRKALKEQEEVLESLWRRKEEVVAAAVSNLISQHDFENR